MINKHLDISPFHFPGDKTGVLLLHGYTSTPAEVRPMGEFLAQQGFTVSAPLLPGHGTSVTDLNTKTWRDVANAAAEALYNLQGECSQVFISGVSMGGLLSLYLAQRCDGIAGVIPMAAAIELSSPLRFVLPIAKYFIANTPKGKDISKSVADPSCASLLWSYEHNPLRFAHEVIMLMHFVQKRLQYITQPLFVVQGSLDTTVPARAVDRICQSVSSTNIETLILKQSSHCLSVDKERDFLFQQVNDWIQDLLLSL